VQVAPKAEDAYTAYLHRLEATVPLSAREETALWNDLLAGGEAADRARRTLIERHLRFVVAIARHYAGTGVPMGDLVQEGNLGLVEAAWRFDPTKGFRFVTYAGWWVRQAIATALARQGHPLSGSIPVARKALKVRQRAHTLTQELGREPSDAELAAAAGLSLDELRDVLAFDASAVSLDVPVGEEGESTLEDLVADGRQAPPEESIIDRVAQEQVAAMISSLPAREQTVLRLRYGLEDGVEHSLQDVGNRLGLTRERVRQIEAKALVALQRQEAAAPVVA
jgi:RNA polymerase sigma factor (sigma-70 family)